jgi:SAM-dependent methyltransferase
MSAFRASVPRHDSAALPFLSDPDFDEAYPHHIRLLSGSHWTPVAVCRTAAEFLVTRANTRVLDIGCGPGKFCAIGAAATTGHFTGVEQRAYLVEAAKSMVRRYGLSRTAIVHANVTDVDFRGFNAFYLFNPFEEDVYSPQQTDRSIELNAALFTRCTSFVRSRLALAPLATRVATYCGDCDEIPECYDCLDMRFNGRLKFWIKTRSQVTEPPPQSETAGTISGRPG